MGGFQLRDTFPMDRWEMMDAFLGRNYREDYVMRDRKLFEWQFSRGMSRGRASVLGAYTADTLIGILGYMPVSVFWGNTTNPIPGAWMANWMVEPRYRNGIGPILMRRLHERFPVMFGQGANALNSRIVERMGLTCYEGIPRFVAVFDDAGTRQLAADGELALPAPWESSNRTADPFGPETDYRPDWEHYQAMAYGTIRDSGYLKWRYLEHPWFQYEGFVAGGPTDPAVCIYRVEETTGAVACRVGRIVEFFHPSSESGRCDGVRALSAALAAMQSANCVFVDLYCTAREFGASALEAGMRKLTHSTLGSRLNPVERKKYVQNLEVWTTRDVVDPPALADYYVTKSDGDQDRPNR